VAVVFGEKATFQRCTIHEPGNVGEHLPGAERDFVDRQLAKALDKPGAAAGPRDANALAGALAAKHPCAATPPREGLDQLFTIARLGIGGTLARPLTSTNPIESMISIARTTNRDVKRSRDGQMVLRWTAAGMRNASRSFRRPNGYRQMPQLISAPAATRPPRPRAPTRVCSRARLRTRYTANWAGRASPPPAVAATIERRSSAPVEVPGPSRRRGSCAGGRTARWRPSRLRRQCMKQNGKWFGTGTRPVSWTDGGSGRKAVPGEPSPPWKS
jgi:hypothetical protein